jgi:DNA-binding transcriptional MerR regulator
MNQQQLTKDMQGKDIGAIETVSFQFADSRIPVMDPKRGFDFVPFGERNDYPSYLLLLYNKSAKHNAIINGKVVYIIGDGLKTNSDQGKAFLAKANEGQSWDQLMRLAALDIETFGGVYFQVIPKLAGGYNVYHVSYDKIRTNNDNTKFYYKEKWDNSLRAYEKEYPAFYEGAKETSIFYFKEYRCGKNTYALPSWVAACNWIESDIEVSKHTLTNAKTGFSASKFINFYNGEPDEDKKRRIQARLENAATGAEGKKLLISFNNDPAKKPTVDDLGQSDLSREDFGTIDNLITNNIFSGHNITHPLLFGIQQEGKLGNATELKTAYEIFKNTYVNGKQKQIEEIVSYFSYIANVDAEYKLKDVEPVGLDLDPTQFKDIIPKEWILEKLGIDVSKYVPLVNGQPVEQQSMSNDKLIQLTGRQQQNLMRIVRLYSQGKLTKAQCVIQLQAYGFTNEQIDAYLGSDNDPNTNDTQFSSDELEFIADMFKEYGESRSSYTIVKSENYKQDDELNFDFAFAAATEYTDNESKIMELLKKQPDLTNEQLSETLKFPIVLVSSILDRLVSDGTIKYDIAKNGSPIKVVTERIQKKTLPEFKVMYSYEKRPEVSGPTLLPTSRPFCQKMVAMSETKLFSMQDIQTLSNRLGYSVFRRAGGFWNNNGVIEYHCRHGWMKHVVLKKK